MMKMKHIFKVKVGREDVLKFSEVSNDYNPIHLDDEYALKANFKKSIAHGMLIAAYISKVI